MFLPAKKSPTWHDAQGLPRTQGWLQLKRAKKKICWLRCQHEGRESMRQKTFRAYPLQWRLLCPMLGTQHLDYKAGVVSCGLLHWKDAFNSGKVSGDKNENRTHSKSHLALTSFDNRASSVVTVPGGWEEGRCYLQPPQLANSQIVFWRIEIKIIVPRAAANFRPKNVTRRRRLQYAQQRHGGLFARSPKPPGRVLSAKIAAIAAIVIWFLFLTTTTTNRIFRFLDCMVQN